MRKKAFTLAELLVALGIVGVIAALTLPSLMNMKQEASAGPQLSKVKASVEDAASRILLEDPSKNLKEYTDFTGKISEYLVMSTAEGGGYRLKDGVVIDFEEATGGHVSNASGSAFKKVNVDLNGTSKPNVAGVDKFEFLLSTQGLLVPQGCAAKLASNNWKVSKDYDSATCSSYTMGETIADTILDDEEYTPEGTKTCADGTVIPSYLSCESNPNCTPIACGCGESWSALDCACKETPGFTKTCTGGKVWSEIACSCVDNETPTPKSCTEDCGCGSCDTTTGKCIPPDRTCAAGQHYEESVCGCQPDEPDTCEKKICTELQTWDEVSCTCETTKKKCEDGTIVDLSIPCPTICKPQTCGCGQEWIASKCACVTRTGFSKSCSNNELQTWDESSCSCVTTKKKCPDGSIVALNATCPEVCVLKKCGKSQIFNEETCKCEAPICDEGFVFNSHTGQCDPTSGSPDDCSTLKGVARDICFCRAEGGTWVYPGTPGYADYLGNSCVVRSNR